MSTKTTNLQLTKPAYGESADIAVINTNMDTIDTAVAGKVTAPSGTVTNNTAVVFDGTTGKLVKSSGKTLGTACSKDFTTAVTSGSAKLVTSGGVYTKCSWVELWINNEGYATANSNQTLSQSVANFSEICLLAGNTSEKYGMNSTILPTHGLAPSSTIATPTYYNWNTASVVIHDTSGSNWDVKVQFVSNTSFKLPNAPVSGMKLYAI